MGLVDKDLPDWAELFGYSSIGKLLFNFNIIWIVKSGLT
jgi:hypothetical protein